MKHFVILSVFTLTVIFGLTVVASAVAPIAAEQPKVQNKI